MECRSAITSLMGHWVDWVATEVCLHLVPLYGGCHGCILCPYMEAPMDVPLCFQSSYVHIPVQYTEDWNHSYRLGMKQCVCVRFPYLHQDRNQQPYIHITEATLRQQPYIHITEARPCSQWYIYRLHRAWQYSLTESGHPHSFVHGSTTVILQYTV